MRSHRDSNPNSIWKWCPSRRWIRVHRVTWVKRMHHHISSTNKRRSSSTRRSSKSKTQDSSKTSPHLRAKTEKQTCINSFAEIYDAMLKNILEIGEIVKQIRFNDPNQLKANAPTGCLRKHRVGRTMETTIIPIVIPKRCQQSEP